MALLTDNAARRARLERLYLDFRSRLFGIARRYVKNDEDAEDVLQDVFCKLAAHIDRVSDDPHKAFSFCAIITKNTALNLLRSQKRLTEADELWVSTDPRPDEIAEKNEQRAQIHRAIDALPELYRQVLLLYFVHNYSLRQIADLLERPYNTVKQQFSRAKAKLRAEIEKEG